MFSAGNKHITKDIKTSNFVDITPVSFCYARHLGENPDVIWSLKLTDTILELKTRLPLGVLNSTDIRKIRRLV